VFALTGDRSGHERMNISPKRATVWRDNRCSLSAPRWPSGSKSPNGTANSAPLWVCAKMSCWIGWRCRFLVYTVLFSVVAGLVSSGTLPSIITTLQKRFGFSSTLMGFVIALVDAVVVVLAIPVGHYGSRGNKARLTAAGFCAINVSLLLFALPHFVTPKYEPDVNRASDRIECNPGGSEDECVARSDGFGQLHPVFQRGCVFAVRFSCPVIHKSSSWVIIFFGSTVVRRLLLTAHFVGVHVPARKR
jgi:hypothetical protein